ncbi:MAG: protein kinase [Deltaproteobacteria bacterium]|nr:protein kinase [Deltaproteobacteria bacterium]
MKAAQPQPIYDLPRGTLIGKYEILRKLATGGMAEIYLARQRGNAGFEKLVVIKRILPNVAEDPSFVRMFLDEARLAATLQHPNIADVYDVGEFEGTPFFAMEYVHGQDVRNIRMASRKRNEHVPLSIALAIVHGTASALDYAHEKTGQDGKPLALVHRDVSSSNVIVSYDGAIKLLDFGIARAASQTHETQTGILKGKIPYMSPEQCRGQPLDKRSDLFSLGVVMYELTTGRRPFRAESDFDVMDQIVHKGAQPPSTVLPGYPPELDAIVMKLLAIKPKHRYGSAEEMLHDLDPFLAAHRLWVSPKPLSRYMKMIFDDKIAAWEAAQTDGVSLAQHVAEHTTSPSQKSVILTPPSAFPALMPISQEMPAVRGPDEPPVRPSEDAITPPAMPQPHLSNQSPVVQRMPLLAPRTEPVPVVPSTPRATRSAPQAVVQPVVETESKPTTYPELRPSRGKALFLVAAVLAVLVGGGAAFVVSNRNSDDNKPKAVGPEPTKVEPTTPEPAKPEPVNSDPVKTEPVKTEPVKTEPDPVKTEPDPVKTEPVKTEPVKPTVTPPRQPPKQPPRQPKFPPKQTPKKPPKETWDPNSPFLPPS